MLGRMLFMGILLVVAFSIKAAERTVLLEGFTNYR